MELGRCWKIPLTEKIQGEQWKDIEGHVGTRKVSSMGRFKSRSNESEKWKLIDSPIKENDYFHVKATKDGDTLAHRIVAKTFIENPEDKGTVNHINHVKTCNCIYNLEWMTQEENNKDCVEFNSEEVKPIMCRFPFDKSCLK